MNAKNYNALMEEQIKNLKGERPALLLHACCAPCSSACIERLKDSFDVTVLFYNPNIEDAEYLRRKAELIRLLDETKWAKYLDCEHQTDEYYSAVKGLETQPEGGARCKVCFALRIDRTAKTAEEGGFAYFATTLTISPLKNAAVINGIGEAAEKARGGRVKWLYSDFKKKDGYLRSLELSKTHSLYRQNYCGCIYSQKPLDK